MNKALRKISSSGIAALAVFLLALNWTATLFYLRADFSEGRVYSISEATKRLLNSLEDPVVVKVYFSRDLPQPYATHGDYLRDLLRAYKSSAGRRFDYQFPGYSNEEEFRKEAIMQGIAPVQMTYISKDKYEVKDGFMGLVILYRDKREVIPVLRDLDGLEYDLTSRIKKLTSETERVLAVYEGKARSLAPDLEKALRENYEIRHYSPTDPLDLNQLPQSLLIYGAQESLSDADLAKIEQMLLRGVSLLLFMDSRSVDIVGGSFFAKPVSTGLERLLAHWGLSLQREWVLDIQNQNVSIQQQAGPYLVNNIVSYPLMPIVTQLDGEHPVSKDLDQLVMPFASPISTANIKSAELTVLARSTRLSWSKPELPNLSPLTDFSPAEADRRGPFVLAASLTGKWNALFRSPPKGAANPVMSASDWLSSSQKEGRIILCSSSRMLDPQVTASMSNQVFLLNAVDWLSQDADLISIRSRGVKIRPFVVAPGYWMRQAIKIISLFLGPLLIAFLGLWNWRRRLKWKASLKEAYQP